MSQGVVFRLPYFLFHVTCTASNFDVVIQKSADLLWHKFFSSVTSFSASSSLLVPLEDFRHFGFLFPARPSPMTVLCKVLFMVHMALGWSTSQLYALSRQSIWLVFPEDGTLVSLAPSLKFLAKN